MSGKRIQIRVSDQEYETLKENAASHNATVTGYILSSTVYAKPESSAGSYSKLYAKLFEADEDLKDSARLLSEIQKQAEIIAQDRKARSSVEIVRELKKLCENAYLSYTESTIKVCDAIATLHSGRV